MASFSLCCCFARLAQLSTDLVDAKNVTTRFGDGSALQLLTAIREAQITKKLREK